MNYEHLKQLPVLSLQEELEATPEQLVEHNYRLVLYLVNSWTNQGVEEEDLIQEGMFGLTEAAARFEPGRAKFATYATTAILNRVRRAVQKAKTVRIPIYLQQEDNELDVDLVPAGTMGDDYDPPDPQGLSPEEQAEFNYWQQRIREGLLLLSDRERDTLVQFYGMEGEPPKSGAQIAREQGVSKGMVSKIRRRAEEKLRKRG